MTCLNLACGREYRDGFVNIDNQQMYQGDFKVDMKADVFDLEWEKNTVDMILVNHFVQYVTPPKMEILLKRWYGWLTYSGEIHIEAGNILEVCKNILESKTVEGMHDKNAIMQLYGIDENIWNKWAWSPQSLSEALYRAGFQALQVFPGHYHENPKRDFLIVAKKILI